MRVVEKGWGHELVWAEGSGYTAKVLHFDKVGSKTSMHEHERKHETWRVLNGRFKFIWIDTSTGFHHEEELAEGDVRTIPPELPHQLMTLTEGAEMDEISTPDDKDDNRRFDPGDSQRAMGGLRMVTRGELVELVREHGPLSATLIAEVVESVGCLSEKERSDVFAFFCTYCGSSDPRCQCWNDE